MPRKPGEKTLRLIRLLKENKSMPRQVLIKKHKFTRGELDCRIPDFQEKGWVEIVSNLDSENLDARGSVYRWIKADE